jgi:hypothetical protein
LAYRFAESLFNVPHHPTHNVMLSELPPTHAAALQPFHGRHVLILIARGRSSTPGILVADYDIPERVFGEREQKLFSGLAGQIGSAIENALLEQEAANAARLEEELRVALATSRPRCCQPAPHTCQAGTLPPTGGQHA